MGLGWEMRRTVGKVVKEKRNNKVQPDRNMKSNDKKEIEAQLN